jgi:2-dehydropantoate 2-reductase
MGGVTYILSYIAAPGVIEHTGGPTTITFGELDGSRSDRAEQFLEWCERADIDADLSEDIRAVLWEKAGFICALAGMTAAVRLPIGAIRSTRESWAMFRRLMEEVYAVAAAEGVDLPAEIVERGLETAEGLEADGYSSLYYDLTHDKPMELDALHGAVVRRGREHGVDVSMTEAVYAILRPWAERNRRNQE